MRDAATARSQAPETAQSLAIGTGAALTGGTRKLGTGRQFTPRNAPSLFNSALGSFYIFWDGRLSEQLGPGRFQTPSDLTLPGGLSGLLAAQAMVPVTNRVEMRGNAGDRDVAGALNEIAQIPDGQNSAIWDAAMRRVLAIAAYQQKFNAAFPASRPVNSAFSTRPTPSPRSRHRRSQSRIARSTAIWRATTTRCRPRRSTGRCSFSEKHSARRATTEHCSALRASRTPACRSLVRAREARRRSTWAGRICSAE